MQHIWYYKSKAYFSSRRSYIEHVSSTLLKDGLSPQPQGSRAFFGVYCVVKIPGRFRLAHLTSASQVQMPELYDTSALTRTLDHQ
jgi:hypothetical protein